MTTRNPVTAFAPLVHLHPNERYMPMGARWFLDRSALYFADDERCPVRKIAVGRELKSQQDPVTDWIYMFGLGQGPTYYREAFRDAACTPYQDEYRYYANQLTRPWGNSLERAAGLQPDEGFYLDLMDWAHQGPAPYRPPGSQVTVVKAPVLYERRHREVDGASGLRLSYWLLFGMNEPFGVDGTAMPGSTHEGDWERLDVVLQGEGSRWEPVSAVLRGPNDRGTALAWEDLERARTHPVVYAARGSHTLYPRPVRQIRRIRVGYTGYGWSRDHAVTACRKCPRWKTWRDLYEGPTQRWYGFGGAWGDVGRYSATTGPLGPHGKWANERGTYGRSVPKVPVSAGE